LGEELLGEQFQLLKLFLSGYFRFQSQLLHPEEVFANYFLSLWLNPWHLLSENLTASHSRVKCSLNQFNQAIDKAKRCNKREKIARFEFWTAPQHTKSSAANLAVKLGRN